MIVVGVILVLFGLLIWWMVRTAGAAFVAKRMAGMVLIIFAVTFITSALLGLVPGDPCVTSLGIGTPQEELDQCAEDRNLNDNFVVRYGKWAGGVLSGDLGVSDYKTQFPLTETLSDRAPRTGWLFLYSQLIALFIAVPMGIWAAYQSGRKQRKLPAATLPVLVVVLFGIATVGGWSIAAILFVALLIPVYAVNAVRGGPPADAVVNTSAFILLSIPVFVLGETLRYVFAIQRDWYDLVGYSPWSEGIGAHLGSIWLPALVLGLAVSPVYLRLLRADMVQNLQQDYVAVARAKGMTNRHILVRHVLRPSTVTLLTVVGLNIAQLVNGAIVVEFIYDFDGMGSWLIDAIASRELFPVQTVVALVAILFVFANTVIDVIYTAVDPRVSAEDEK